MQTIYPDKGLEYRLYKEISKLKSIKTQYNNKMNKRHEEISLMRAYRGQISSWRDV